MTDRRSDRPHAAPDPADTLPDRRSHRGGLGLTFVRWGTGVIGVGFLVTLITGSAPAWATWGLAVGIGLLLFGFFELGGTPRDPSPEAGVRGPAASRLRWVFGATAVWVGVGLGFLLTMTPADPGDPDLFLGLPSRAAWMIYGIGLAPALFLPLAYAAFFDDLTLSERSLDRLRAVARRVAAERAAAAAGGSPGSSPDSGGRASSGEEPR